MSCIIFVALDEKNIEHGGKSVIKWSAMEYRKA